MPDKYSVVDNITDYLEDFEHIRLTKSERKSLDLALFAAEIDWFIRDIKKNEPMVYKLIQNAKPLSVSKVRTIDGEILYQLKMCNNLDVVCTKQIYRLSPVKIQTKQKAPIQQLTLF